MRFVCLFIVLYISIVEACSPENLQVEFEDFCYTCDDLNALAEARCIVYDTVPTTWPIEKEFNNTGINITCTPYVCVEPDYMLHCASPNRLPSSPVLDNYITLQVTDTDSSNERVKMRPFINWDSPHLYYNKPGYSYGGGLEYVSSWINTATTMDYPFVELDDHDHCIFRMNREGSFDEQWQDTSCFDMTVDGTRTTINFYLALTICYTNLDEAACESQTYAFYDDGVPVSWQRPAYRTPYLWNKVWYGSTAGHNSICIRNWQYSQVVVVDGTVEELSDSVTINSVSIIDPDDSPVVNHDDVITIGPSYNVTLDSGDFDMTFEHYHEGVWSTMSTSNAVHYLRQTDFYRIVLGDRYRFSLSVKNKPMFSEDNLREAIANKFVSATVNYEWQYDKHYDGIFIAGDRYTAFSHQVEALTVNDFVVDTSFECNLPYFVEDSMRLVVFIEWQSASGRRLSTESLEYQPSWGKNNGAIMVYGYTALPKTNEGGVIDPVASTENDNHKSEEKAEEEATQESNMTVIFVCVLVALIFVFCGFCLLKWEGRAHTRKWPKEDSSSGPLLTKSDTLAYKNIHVGVIVQKVT